jgi:YD repeat-containing protein
MDRAVRIGATLPRAPASCNVRPKGDPMRLLTLAASHAFSLVIGLWGCSALADTIPPNRATSHAGGTAGSVNHGPESNDQACAHVVQLFEQNPNNPPEWVFECAGITLINPKMPPVAGPFPWAAEYRTDIRTIKPGGVQTVDGFQMFQKFGCPAGYTIQGQTAESSWCWNGVGPNTPPVAPIDPKKNLGCPFCLAGNPLNVGTGNKYQAELDYKGAGAHPLHFERFYNSGPAESTTFEAKWRGSYDRSIQGGAEAVTLKRADGRQFTFVLSGSSWKPDDDVVGKLEQIPSGWKFTNDTDEVETFDAEGKLVSLANRAGLTQTLTYSCKSLSTTCPVVTPDAVAPVAGLLITVADPFGRQLNFTYESGSRVITMTDPAGGIYEYTYASVNLASVKYPGGATRSYLYGEAAHVSPTPDPGVSYASALTGLIDENGHRYATWSYDAQGRAVSSEHAVGVNKVTLTFNANGTTSVVDALGGSQTYQFQTIHGMVKSTGQTRHDSASRTETLDANGNVATSTDWNGNRTNYVFDLTRNLQTSRTEGLTSGGGSTPQTRTISTQWHATFRVPIGIAEPLRITTLTYDSDGSQCGARGALCSKSMQATTDANGSQGFSATTTGPARTWSYTYNSNGRVLTVNGPRTDVSDVTTYTYHANDDTDPGKRGNLSTITNAAGHVTSITAYNAHSQPLSIVDANSLTTTLVYDVRRRLIERAVGAESTLYDYDDAGQLTRVTLPDASFLSYTYDAAHRLTQIEDNLGNRITYSLDAMGNRTLEEMRDPPSQLAQKRSREFSNLNRLFKELGATSQTTEYGYDNQGNVVSIKDPLNRVTINQYDALNRLKQSVSPAPISAQTQYGYDGLDQLASVSDPRGLVTSYAVNGLGDLAQQVSPDTGTTVNGHDTAGNLTSQTDAKGQQTLYAYDALNRVTLVTFHDGSKQAFAYDQGTNGVGRLSSITESDPASQITGATVYGYDQHGRVTSETRTIAGVQHTTGYAYDASGRLSGLTYPSGTTVTYGFDALGRVNQITTATLGIVRTVAHGVLYHPLGIVKAYTLGNGQTCTRSIDLDGRISSYTPGADTFPIVYDDASRISILGANSYGYDNLDRLTTAVLPTTPYTYVYDAVGNRLSRTAGTSTDNYIYNATNNRIASITPASGPVRNFGFDANGSTTADGINTYTYDTRGRMVQATSSIGATSYQVNALGQRVRKSNSLGQTIFHYDLGGRLIAETDTSGAVKREYIYLGDIPVAMVRP